MEILEKRKNKIKFVSISFLSFFMISHNNLKKKIISCEIFSYEIYNNLKKIIKGNVPDGDT